MKPLIKFAIAATAVLSSFVIPSSAKALEEEDFMRSFELSAQVYCEARYSGENKTNGYDLAVETLIRDLRNRSEYPDYLLDSLLEARSDEFATVLYEFIEVTCPDFQ